MLKDNKLLVTCVVLVSLFLLYGLFTVFAYQRAGKIPFTFKLAPSDATIRLNDTKVSTGTIYLKPGTYTVNVTREGFVSYKKTIAVTEGTDKLSIALVPVSRKATEWVTKNKDTYEEAVRLMTEEKTNGESRLQAQNPITKKLPFKNMLYSITYHADPTDTTGSRIVLDISATQVYRHSALTQINRWGFDPTDYQINFIGYTNPLL